MSAAYYALFHRVTEVAAEHLLGAAQADERARLRRTWRHGELFAAATLIVDRARVLTANPAAPPTREERKWGPLVRLAASDSHIVESARLFRELQVQRHAADYDHLARFDKAALLSAIQDAEDGIAHIADASADGRQALTGLLIVRRPDLDDR